MKKLLWTALLTGFLVIFGIYGYNKWFVKASGNEISIEKDSAKALNVDIDFSVGELFIHGGASDWINGEFSYTNKKLEPKVKYKLRQNVGFFDIKQGSLTVFGFNKNKLNSEWDLQLTNDIPIDLDVKMGVSESTLELSGIQLNSLSIDSGVSESVIDLSGEWKKGFEVDMDLGVGDVTIILPKKTGVKLTVSKGIGVLTAKDFTSVGNRGFVNEAYEDADVIINVKLDIGIGDVKVQLAE